MAKFCSKCGKPLVDGKPCDCEKENEVVEKIEETKETQKEEVVEVNKEKEETTNNETSQTVQIATDTFNKLVKMFKSFLLKPIDTIKEFKEEENMKESIILIVLNSLIYGLALYFFVNNFIKGIVSKINSLAASANTISSILSGETFDISELNFQIPVLKFVLVVFACFIVGNAVLVLMQKLFAGIIFKTKGTLKEFFAVHSVTTIINTVAIVLATICSMFSLKLAILVILLGIVIYFVCITQVYLDVMEANKNTIAYNISITLILGYVAAVIAMGLIISVVAKSMINNYMANSAMQEAIDAAVMQKDLF